MKTTVTLLFILLFTVPIFAAGEVDPAFNAAVYRQSSFDVLAAKLQPDGKLLVGGIFGVLNGTNRHSIARLNADGTLDASFNPPELFDLNNNARPGNVYAIALQPDGKILVGGSFGTTNSTYRSLIRLNGDGSLDTTFANLSAQFGNTELIYEIHLAPNNFIYINGNLELDGANYVASGLARLNASGAIDTTFQFARVAPGINTVRSAAVTTDNLVYATVTPQIAQIFFRRYNADGSPDAAFPRIDVGGSVFKTVIQTDGKVLLGGNFSRLNGIAYQGISRINPDGTIDTNFNPGFTPALTGAYDIDLTADGKIVVAGNFSAYRNVNGIAVARLNLDGSRDATFASPFVTGDAIQTAEVQSDGKIIIYSLNSKFQRLNQDGTIDTGYATATFGISGIVYDIAQQPDGKIIAVGDFSAAGNLTRYSVARFNQDGSLDAGFNQDITPAAIGMTRQLVLLADGKILIASASGLLRLNADGTKDASFMRTFDFSFNSDLVVLPDGKILFARFGAIVRLQPNGAADNTFSQPNVGGLVSAMSVQPDGKIVIGGSFTQVNGVGRGRIARLNADGTLDATFGVPIGLDNTVNDIDSQADGKVVAAGAFTLFNGNVSRPYIARFNSNGTLDETFATTANNQLFAVKVQPDGKILLGGSFTQINGAARNRYARLNADGNLDGSFGVPTGANNTVYKIALQTDGKILLGGAFSRVNNVSAVGIARLLNAPTTARPPFDFDGDRRSDVSLFRPTNGVWYILPSQTGNFYGFQFGQASDLIAPADYDGDGKTDVAVFRPVVAGAGDQAYFYILNSADNSFRAVGFGTNGDVPVSGDWDGDGKADYGVYRAAATSGGQSNFYYLPSAQPAGNFVTISLGTGGDKPIPADYDGDGRLDPAVFRPSNATWYILRSSVNQITTTAFGLSTDIPTPADYDGDGAANIAVFRPSNGTWFTSQNPQNNFGAVQFGANGDLPVPADYDGDGRADVAVFRPSNGAWYLNRSTSGFTGVQFGASGDKPSPNAYIR